MKKFFASFLVSLALVSVGYAGDDVQIIVKSFGAPTVSATNAVATNAFVYQQQAYPPTRPPVPFTAPEQVPTQLAPQQPQQLYTQPSYAGVVVTPAGRPVEQMGDYVPYAGYSYGNPRRGGYYSYGAGGSTVIVYGSQTFDHRGSFGNVRFQSSHVVTQPVGRGNVGGGGYSRPKAYAPPRVYHYVTR